MIKRIKIAFLVALCAFMPMGAVVLSIGAIAITPAVVLAEPSSPENPRQADGSEESIKAAASRCQPGKGGLPLPTWYQYLPGKTVDGSCEINTEGLGGNTVILILMGVFDILLYLAGAIAVIMVIWGGFKLLTSDGEPQKIASARTTIFNALVGLVIAAVASQIVGLIAGGLT